MSAEEELQEHAEHAKQPFDKKVAATMAIIAAAMAVVTVLGQLSVSEELLSQQKASDQWSYYQAKSIRRYQSDVARDMLVALKGDSKMADKYAENGKKYREEGDKIQDGARELEKESAAKGREALRFHFGEVFLEIALVFASLAILTKRSILWLTAIALGAVGIGSALTTLML